MKSHGQNDTLEVILECSGSVNLAFQQNAIPVLQEFRIRNAGPERRGLVVRVTAEPAFCEPHEIRLDSLTAGEEFRSPLLEFKLNPTFLDSLTEKVRGQFRVECLEGEQVLAARVQEIFAMPRNEWCGADTFPVLLAAYVLPNDPAVVTALDGAANILRQQVEGGSLNGYQSQSAKHVADQVAAIHSAIVAMGIRYISPPASFERAGQKVRFPSDIKDQRFGTCLDLALFFAACCEQVGLHPLVLMHQGHAYAGCWLAEESLPESAMDDLQMIRKRVELGEMIVWEATTVTADNRPVFADARALAEQHLKRDSAFQMVLDIHRARKEGILPLPTKGVLAEAVSAPSGQGPAKLEAGEIPESAGAAVKSEPQETPALRIARWKNRLLDLTLRNRLLNFKETKGSVPILAPNPEHVEDALGADELKLQPVPKSMGKNDPRSAAAYLKIKKTDPLATFLQDQLAKKILHTPLDEEEHDKRLLKLFRDSRASLEENGVNTLYAAVGILEWKDDNVREGIQKAPILLVPVELKRKSVSQAFSLRKIDEDPRINTTLLEMLRQKFQLEIDGLDPLPEDDNGIDAKKVLQIFKRAVRDLSGWEVKAEVWLGQFSFSKFLLWKDLNDRMEALLENRVVAHLVNTPEAAFSSTGEEIHSHELDGKFPPKDVFCPRSADSSQLAAVMAAAAGQDFVLEGPPGTGKSQTISNIIAQCVAEGKRVLFVAEKRTALDVVYNRLKEEGLEAFCLQLHSNKIGKTEVLAQFKSTIDLAEQAPVREWSLRASELEKVRNSLNNYSSTLHKTYPSGLTAFQCIGHLASLTDADFVALPNLGDPTLVSETRLEELDALCRRLEQAVCDAEGIGGHPLAEIGLAAWSPALAEELLQKIRDLKNMVAGFRPALNEVASVFKAPARGFSIFEIYNMNELGASIQESEPAGPDLVGKPWSEVSTLLESWKSLAAERAALREKLSEFDEASLLQADPSALQKRWKATAVMWPGGAAIERFHLRKELARHSKNQTASAGQARIKLIKEVVMAIPETVNSFLGKSGQANDVEIETILRDAARLQEIGKRLEEARPQALSMLGPIWRDGEPLAGDIARAQAWAETLHERLNDLAGRDAEWLGMLREFVTVFVHDGNFQKNALDAVFSGYTEKLAALMNGFNDLAAALELDRGAVDGWPDHLFAIDEMLARFESHWQRIRMWCSWRAARRDGIDAGVEAFVDKLESMCSLPPSGSMCSLLERSFRKGLLYKILEDEPLLRDFSESIQNSTVENFRKKDAQFADLTKRAIAARLFSKLAESKRSDQLSPCFTLLQREISKKTRHMPVRKLLKEVQDALPAMKPCFLMSPLSVAQYLDPALPPFDLVIFDEASQIPVWDSVGAIARGHQLIVVGDPKQLPPTNFFARKADADGDEDEENLPQEDLESILDELMGAGMRHKRLKWHYRSRHEGLIAFSNRIYYENDLFTFPSPVTGHGGVAFHHVSDGCYDHGKSRTNRVEAEALVEHLVRRLRDPQHSKRSHGVVTFSMAQQALIEGLLEAKCREYPEIEKFFSEDSSKGFEPVFVKNLENVQGDERDVILFSICYGPDAAGKVSLNFGPLTRAGGERRLNVAITRARQEMVVFSTLRADQIDPNRRKANGVRDLKYFLDFAERGPVALTAATSVSGEASAESEFERLVADRLRREGYEVHHQIGCSGYRIDLAIVDPKAPGRYLAGIECDGATYHRAQTARDRDKLRQAVLEGLGWKLHRIWSTDWWHDPEKQIRHLIDSLTKK